MGVIPALLASLSVNNVWLQIYANILKNRIPIAHRLILNPDLFCDLKYLPSQSVCT